MVAASLYSLYRNAERIPNKVYLVSDGSWAPEIGERYFAQYKLPLECLTWKTCADHYAETCPDLTIWAQRHIWGKKMAAILYCSENRAAVFSDPDVLWYQSPLKGQEETAVPFRISIDNSLSYDQACLKALHLEYLNEREVPVNCGIVYIKGGLELLNEEAHRIITYQAEHCGPFAEQTVFAAMDAQYDSRWSESEVRSDLEGALHPFFGKVTQTEQLIARHYLWFLKPLYWKELLHMYFSRKRKEIM